MFTGSTTGVGVQTRGYIFTIILPLDHRVPVAAVTPCKMPCNTPGVSAGMGVMGYYW